MKPHSFIALAYLSFFATDAAAAIQVEDLSIHGSEITLGVDQTSSSLNKFGLQYKTNLSAETWEPHPSARLLPVNSRRSEFRLPKNNAVASEFYTVIGSQVDGAPSHMTQISGGTLPALSSLGAIDVASHFQNATEVTQAEWDAVSTWASSNGYDLNNTGAGCGSAHPIHSVSWYEVLKWCNARSEQAGLTPVYLVNSTAYRSGETAPTADGTANGFRLPTEAEWEFAARGGNSSRSDTYSGGNDSDLVAWHSGNSNGANCDLDSGRGTWPTGQKTANELGQQDMSGNVAEWCWAESGSTQPVRGGSWNEAAANAALSNRDSASPNTRLNTIGFRTARNIDTFAANQAPVATLHTPILEQTNIGSGRVFIIGDSTVANYNGSQYPWRGWGQSDIIQHFFDSARITTNNRARGGRSSKSFIVEGLWDNAKAELATGDFLLIQWGHNDRDWTKPERYTSEEEYKGYLRQYINEARALGVQPIFVTPMVMNAWSGATMRNVFTESGNDYAGWMKAIATELSVPLVDLNAKSHAFFSPLNYDTCGRYYYNTYVAGEYPNYPNGNTDGTHFQEMGALMMAKWVTDGLRELKSDPDVGQLAAALMPQYPIDIKANITSAGSVSLSTEFPAGPTFTLKALVASGHSFIHWNTGSNTLLSTDNLTTFTVPASSTQYIAYFDNQTIVSAPATGSTIPGGDTINYQITLQTDAYDPDGTISRVEYFGLDTGSKIGEATTPPYQLVWDVMADDTLVWGEAIDNEGARSHTLSFQIDTTTSGNIPPTVTLTSPTSGSGNVEGDTVSLTANAIDSDGTVAKVVFFIDGSFFDEDSSAPYSTSWSQVAEGSYSIEARAIDNLGYSSSSSSAQITVFGALGGPLLQEAETGTLVGSFTIIDDASASGGQAVEAVSGGAALNYVEFRFNVPTAGNYRLRTLEKSIDGAHDSMFVSVNGASAEQYLWYCARSSWYLEDYVSSTSADPVILTLNAGLNTVRFGYRENMFLDLVELELVP